EMDGHDRLRPRRDPGGHVLGIEVQRDRVDVREDRRRTSPRDRLGGRVERERGTDDLVARADLHRVEDEDESVGAVGDADRVWDAEVVGGLALERLDVRAEDEGSGVDDRLEAALELRDERRELRFYIDMWDWAHWRGSLAGPPERSGAEPTGAPAT